MDLKTLGKRNSSAVSLASRQSSGDSAASATSKTSRRSRLLKLLPGRKRRTSAAEAASDEQAVDPQQLGLVSSNSDSNSLVLLDDGGTERYLERALSFLGRSRTEWRKLVGPKTDRVSRKIQSCSRRRLFPIAIVRLASPLDSIIASCRSASCLFLPPDPSLPLDPSFYRRPSVPDPNKLSSQTLPQRPSLSTHQSHAGFLTLSSPLIPVETLPSRPLDPPSAATIPPSRTDALSATPSSARRSTSPIGSLRALTPSRSKTAAGSGGGGDAEADPAKSGGGRGIKELLSRGRRATDSQRPKDTKRDSSKSSENLAPVALPAASGAHFQQPADGPQTLVTPPTPTDLSSDPESASLIISKHRRTSSAPDGEALDAALHRRAKSPLAPSKLSQLIARPLTPAEEDPKESRGTLTAQQSGGFFSSVLSAAQNAATSISNTITLPGKNKANTEESSGGEEVIVSNKPPSLASDSYSEESRKPAIDTLGSGNLSLSHLGISGSEKTSPMSSKVNLLDSTTSAPAAADEAAAKKDDNAAAKAVSKAYSEKTNGEKPQASPEATRPPPPAAEDVTPVRQSVEPPDAATMKRASSVRSKQSGGRRRATRGSSNSTTPSLAVYALPPLQYTKASPKRNRDFHNFFKSVPEDDLLIDDWSAALQREILIQGRLYVSEGHICFWSNIFGFVTTLVMSFEEIIAVEKKATAMIFQNGIVIQTLHARNVFASLMNRDTVYELIISIWRTNHPNLRRSLNGHPVDGLGTSDRTEKAASIAEDDSASEEVYDEDYENETGSHYSYAESHDANSTASDADLSKPINRKVSSQIASMVAGNTTKTHDAAEAAVAGTAATADFPGPVAHEATDCGDQESHGERLLIDTTIPAPLGKVFSLMFGRHSASFMKRWLVEEQRATEMQIEDDKQGLGPDRKVRNYSYVKPLTGPISPKQTRCIIAESLEQHDLEKATTVSCSTQTPDVPSGNTFVVVTRYCLMWAPGNCTRLVMTYGIEWNAKSWFKAPIEKGALDGQTTYAKDLAAALRSAVSKAPGGSRKSPHQRRRPRRRSNSDDETTPSPRSRRGADAAVRMSTLERVARAVVGGDVADLASSGPGSLVLVALFVATVLAVLWRGWSSSGGGGGSGAAGMAAAERRMAYEDLWRVEEGELWRWMEERAGVDVLRATTPAAAAAAAGGGGGARPGGAAERLRRGGHMAPRGGGVDWGALDGMDEREVMEAIRVTKERLERLEGVVRQKEGRVEGSEAEAPSAQKTD